VLIRWNFGQPLSEPEVTIFSRFVGDSGLVAMLLHFERRVERRRKHHTISFRSGCVLLEGMVFGEIIISIEGKIGKMVKNSITSIDRETYFGSNIFGNIFVKHMKIIENMSGDFEFLWNFRKFFITDSGSTGLNRRSSVGIFFLSTSVPEMTCLESCI